MRRFLRFMFIALSVGLVILVILSQWIVIGVHVGRLTIAAKPSCLQFIVWPISNFGLVAERSDGGHAGYFRWFDYARVGSLSILEVPWWIIIVAWAAVLILARRLLKHHRSNAAFPVEVKQNAG